MSIGPAEIMVVLVVALLVVGPQRLPEMARKAGQGWRDLQRLQQSLRDQVDGALNLDDALDDTPDIVVPTAGVPTTDASPAGAIVPDLDVLDDVIVRDDEPVHQDAS